MTDLLSKAKALEEAHRKPLHPRIEEAKGKFEETFGPVKVEELLTEKQRNALHLWFRQLAKALNDAGWDARKTLKAEVEIPWTEQMIKSLVWKSVQKIMVEKESTTKLNTKEVNLIYEVVDRHLSEKTGVHVEFPHDEEKP